MLQCVDNELVIIDVKDINYEGLKIQGAQDAICIDDLNIKPLLTGKLHTQVRTNTNSITLSPRLVRVNVNDVISSHAPIIHHTVVQRFTEVSDYRPYALRNVHFKIEDEQGNTSKIKHGISSLD